jgi:hypothetical protein
VTAADYVVPVSPLYNLRFVDPILKASLNTAVKYYQQTWWAAKGYPAGQVTLQNTEQGLRGAGMVALAIAATTETSTMDPAYGTDYARARLDTARLVAACARQHVAVTAGGWGGGWQTALWAWHAGLAGWLHWTTGVFTVPADLQHVAAMVEYEGDFQLGQPALFWRDADDVEIYPGDTKLEESSWNALLLALASAMMPGHPHADAWAVKAAELAVTATAVKVDLDDQTVVSGRSVADWIGGRGYNVNPDYSVVNHGKINPDYAICVIQNLAQGIGWGLAGQPLPAAARWNTGPIYTALQTIAYPTGPVYQPGTATVNYPFGADWGNRRSAGYAACDAALAALGVPGGPRSAGYWRDLHERDTLLMQRRSTTGAVYQSTAEDSYSAREEWAMSQVAVGYLLQMMAAAGRLT